MGALWVIAVLLCSETAWTFESAAADQLPPGWVATKTGEGPGSVWKVALDGQEKVLAQTSSAGGKRYYNVCVAAGPRVADLDLSVSMKPVSGKIDQGGGPLWRYQDAQNYYVCRWNPLEDNFRLYQVVNGRRTQMDHADLKVAADKWHTIRVTQQGRRIDCYFDGQHLLEAEDSAITNAGQVGLWSKADAVTYFKALAVKELPPAVREGKK
jgi:hypothetical protein